MKPTESRPVLSRRQLIPGAAGIMAVPRHVLGGPRFKAPSDTLNLAGVGVGGMGAGYVRECASENIIALCDVDHEYAARTFEKYPKARLYRDFRKMLEQEKEIDGVIIGTPDHTHAVIAAAAMSLGKHVYCAKPLTRTIHEARVLARMARTTGVATQMSVQSSASDGARAVEEWIQAGAIGTVRDVHVWSDRPLWPHAVGRPKETPPVPSSLDWDLWLGPAPRRPYHPAYHPWIWRGWWDFGTGATGDMGCHTLHVIVRALNLDQPVSVHATAAAVVRGYQRPWEGQRPRVVPFPETAPHASIITWNFPARGEAPPVRVTWYDGGLKPPRPPELEPERELGRQGILFMGDNGTLLSGFSGGPALVPETRNKEFQPPEKTLPRTIGHYQEWIAACKGGPPASCEFGFGTLLTEITLLGNIAVRTGKLLHWNAIDMKITNDYDANQYLREPCREGWGVAS
jgi:predicted dehydrogenase